MLKFSVMLISILSLSAPLHGEDHSRHVSHGMLLFGTEEVFADHIVYKEPHNYQIILKVEFDGETKQKYLDALSSYPSGEIIFMLDPLDIETIPSAFVITGKIIHRHASAASDVQTDISLASDQFEVVYFKKLPLSLSGSPHDRNLCEPICPRYPVNKCQ